MNILSNIEKFTVSQLNYSIKNLIENKFQIVSVIGEVSQVKKHGSGHIYFSLKDEESVISAICWRSVVPRLKINLEDGIKVEIKGKVTTYSQQSKYQLIVQQIVFEGEGNLLKLLEQRKRRLAELGFFDESKKKEISKFPNSIGVITSESGAVIKDIIHRVSDRFPTKLLIYPSNVQGEKCLDDIIRGIEYFNIKKDNSVDVIIIARGGGSLEDLMPFNEELLVKKIFESKIPIVSAVGHETDYTLCDLVSDLRAPTPSAAVEMILPNRKEILIRLLDSESKLKKIFAHFFDNHKLSLKLLSSKIPELLETVNNHFQELDYHEQGLKNFLNSSFKNMKINLYRVIQKFSPGNLSNMVKLELSRVLNNFEKSTFFINQNLDTKKERFNSKSKELSILSYKQTLKRGFAVIRKEDVIIKNDLEIKHNDKIEIEFATSKTKAKKI